MDKQLSAYEISSESRYLLDTGLFNSSEAIMIHFEVVRGNALRVTKEYSLVYIPEANEWFGDIIAYGQWWDLEPDDVLQLREAYNLDALMQDYLEHGGEQQVTYDRYAAAK